MSDLIRFRGDTTNVRAVFTNPDGSPYNLTDCNVTFTASDHENPVDGYTPEFSIDADLGTPTAGIATFEWSATEADFLGTFWYDVKLVDPNGKIKTVTKGRLVYKQRVWVATP